ncbi:MULTISPECIES: VanR-ABDEGLN family response regulator transcription factor [unclassified Paenibacillus]|uniref:VanR-ABDEGLN family response regulator transcription factor n=1 Tax=Paenibacillus provencensis TaxID=441151 RepID=A0ABW3Q654_9BACL|nr:MULTISPECIES: VanR-ABDEGLN family response regulator transcription factor [unclassified Paenibacillus]MCM3129876.1 VanR-ABDEGLN family response regulator transcription factor [Paenibacillus sp. MER 78]SFS91279.1 two component transcriptional regulator, winged helix family [Paenibacillus sp. 453mf]
MSTRILVVDDEKEIADLVELYLKAENYEVYKFYSGKEALDCIQHNKLNLAILDVMLPDMSGFDICQQIREKHHFPIIMLTAKEEEIDKITGLTLGADDYVTKPFRPLELVARVKAQLRRFTKYNLESPHTEDDKIIAFSGLLLNKNTHECYLNEKLISLTPTEFSILWMLCSNRGQVLSSEQIFQEVWGEKYYTNNNTVMVHIRHLREKMNDHMDKPKYIKTVWGVGYKVEG